MVSRKENTGKGKKSLGQKNQQASRYKPRLVLSLAWFALIATFLLLKVYEHRLITGLQYRFSADIYILPKSTASAGMLSMETWADIALDAVVAAAAVTQIRSITLEGKTARLIGTPLTSPLHCYRWRRPPPDAAIIGSPTVEPAYASERFAQRFKLDKGQVLYLSTPQGPRQLILAGIFAEYGRRQGSLVIDRSTFSHWFEEDAATYLAVAVKPGWDQAAVRKRWQAAYPQSLILSRTTFHRLLIHQAQPLLRITYTIQAFGAFGLAVLTWVRWRLEAGG